MFNFLKQKEKIKKLQAEVYRLERLKAGELEKELKAAKESENEYSRWYSNELKEKEDLREQLLDYEEALMKSREDAVKFYEAWQHAIRRLKLPKAKG